jgi:transcriptional regulator with XRE-family HTH domain
MDLWDRIKTEVKSQNTTQAWVAEKAKIPFGTFQRWLSHKTMPNADQLLQIARALNTTVEYLIDGEKPDQLTPQDRIFHERALKYKELIDALDSTDESVRQLIIAGAMAQADLNRIEREGEVRKA